MKKILSTISSQVLTMAFVMTLVLGSFSTVSAGYYGWNNSSGDCPTFVVANITTSEGVSSGCWTSTSIDAKENDVIYLTVYFANHTGDIANDVRVKVNNINGKTGNVSFGGTVYEYGRNVASGSASISLAPNTKLVYQKTFVGYQGDKFNYTDQNISASTLESAGVNVGPVDDDWNDQGNVKVKYLVVAADTSSTGAKPVVNTDAPTVSGTTVTLNGNVSPEGLSTTAWFDLYDGSTCSSNGRSVGSRPVGTTFGAYSHQINSLASGTYSYYAVAKNSAGPVTATQCKMFTIGNGSGNSNSTLNIVTNLPTNLSGSTGSVTLNGLYTVNTPGTLYFEIFNNKTYSNTPSVRYVNAGSSSYSLDLSGLPDGYYTYRAYFKSDNGIVTKGSDENFSISRTVNNNTCSNGATNYPTCTFSVNSTSASATTFDPISYTASQATLSGQYNMGNTSGQTWFQWGPTSSLGNTTNSIPRATGATGPTSQTIYGLNADTTYYYRVVAQNTAGVVYGDIKSFTTPRATILNRITRVIAQPLVRTTRTTTVTTTPITTDVTTTVPAIAEVGGTGVKYLRLNIDNEQNDIARGESVSYEVQWENISSDVTLKDLVLEVTLPKELRITDASRGDVDTSANAVYLNIDQLDPREDGRMTIDARVVGSVRDNAPAVARAIMAFKNPTLQGFQENAIAYDSDKFSASSAVLGAFAGGSGFLPATLAGWLIIALIIILIILAARHYMRNGYYGNDDRDNGPYTPYRPQA